MKKTDERVQEFLTELTQLCQKHNLKIDGCGCCGSPWITDAADWDDISESIGNMTVC